MLQFPRWKVTATVGNKIVKTLYETATTAAEAIAKAKYKLRGAVSSAGAFKFKAKKVAADDHLGHKGGECDRCDAADKIIEKPSHATKTTYGPKASEKIGRTLHEFKRGKLKSGGGGKKVTSRKQAVAIGISQARREGYKVPPAPPRQHATMSLDARVRAYLSHMRPGTEVDARGLARGIGGGVDPIEAEYALERAAKAGLAVTSDGRWFGPAGGQVTHATRKKTPSQLDAEIADVLGGSRSSHASKKKPRPTPYRIKLSPSELSAVEFASGRYSWPDMLASHASEDGSIAFTESEMWQWTDDVDSDAEGGHSPFPLAAGAFAEKLQHFYDERI